MNDEYTEYTDCNYFYEYKYNSDSINEIKEKEISKYKLIVSLCEILIELIISRLPLSNTIIIDEGLINLNSYAKMFNKSILGDEISKMTTKILFPNFEGAVLYCVRIENNERHYFFRIALTQEYMKIKTTDVDENYVYKESTN